SRQSVKMAAHRAACQTGAQRQRVRFGKEPRQNEREVTFSKKVAANDMTSAATWRSRRDSNPRAVSAATRFPVVLVMTTSILLQIPLFRSRNSKMYYTSFFWIVKPKIQKSRKIFM